MLQPLKISTGTLAVDGVPVAIDWSAWPATVWLTWRGYVVAALAKNSATGLYWNGVNASLQLAEFANGYVGWSGSFGFAPFQAPGGNSFGWVEIDIARAYNITLGTGIAVTGPYTRTSAATVQAIDAYGVLQDVDCTGAIRVHLSNPA